MKVALFILLIIIVLFLPIPFKIYITFENNELIVRLYNKNIHFIQI